MRNENISTKNHGQAVWIAGKPEVIQLAGCMRKSDQIGLRIPPELKRALLQIAKKEG
jgi:hypothetical protein